MRSSLSRVYTLTSRNFKEILRDPLSLIFMLAMPLAMEVLFYFLFHEMTDQFAMNCLAPGIVVFAQAFLALFTGLLIALDRSTAFLTRLYVSRAKSAEFIFGYALALIPAVLVQTVLFFVVGGIIDPSIWGIGMLRCLPVALCTSLVYIGVGILLGTLCNEKSVGGVASIVIAGQSVLSGMWFPPEGLPSGMVALMKCLPFKNAADCMRSALNGAADPAADFWIPFCIVLAYAAVSFAAAIFFFRRRMRFR